MNNSHLNDVARCEAVLFVIHVCTQQVEGLHDIHSLLKLINLCNALLE